jgi:hypothetical protein
LLSRNLVLFDQVSAPKAENLRTPQSLTNIGFAGFQRRPNFSCKTASSWSNMPAAQVAAGLTRGVLVQKGMQCQSRKQFGLGVRDVLDLRPSLFGALSRIPNVGLAGSTPKPNSCSGFFSSIRFAFLRFRYANAKGPPERAGLSVETYQLI